MAAPFLIERDVDPSGDGVSAALIMRLLLGLSGPSYFRALADQPRMAEALWATIRELRGAGLGSADLPLNAFESVDKHAELSALLRAYEAHLSDHRLADMALVYREALQHLDVCPVLPGALCLEMPGVLWTPLERALLDALPGTRLTPAALQLPGVARPRRHTGAAAWQPPVARSDAERLAFLLTPFEAPEAEHDGTLTMFRAGGKEAEVEEVFRRILEAGVSFDHVEVACASPDYAPLFWEKCQRHAWPVTIGPGVPATLTRPARALLAFLDWIEGGFPAEGLRRLLQSGDVRLGFDGGPTAGQAARLLARSTATWGRQTYRLAMTALAAGYQRRAADPEADETTRSYCLERAEQVERLGTWTVDLVRLAPEPADGRLGLGVLVDGCATFLATVAAKSNELDGAAAVVLGEALADLKTLGDFRRPLGDLLRLIRHQIEPLTIGSDRARPGHLFVTTLREAGYAGRPSTFVVGLEEGRVFPALIEDPVLLDAEREAISPALATSADRASEALHAVVSRLAALGGQVCLSFACRDLRQHRETFPSWLLLQALRLLRREDLTYGDLNDALAEPVSAVPCAPERALSDVGWWLSHVDGVGASAVIPVHAAFAGLAHGEAAEAARTSDLFTRYDGFVPEAAASLDPRVSGHPVSATRLQGLAVCPFRYFLERGLGLEAAGLNEADRDVWLDPLTRGSLLHDLYATIMRELRARKQKADPAHHVARLRALGEAALEKIRAEMPPPSEHVFTREREELLHDLDRFLRREASETGREPVYFEIPFGMGTADGENIGQADAMILDFGDGMRFRLRGRIDRIDRLADGTYEVIDYKTGRLWNPDFAGTFQGGRLLQHALYALAATQLLQRLEPAARVTSSCYYFPTVRGGGERVVCPAVTPTQVAGVLRDLFDTLGRGAFVHTDDDCTFCELEGACGLDPDERAGRKLANPANTMLDPYRRLVKHE